MANLLEMYEFFNEKALGATFYTNTKKGFNKWQYFIERVLDLMLKDYAEYELSNHINLPCYAEAFLDSIFDCIRITETNRPAISKEAEELSNYLLIEPYMYTDQSVIEELAEQIAISSHSYALTINANIAQAFFEISYLSEKHYQKTIDVFSKVLEKGKTEEKNGE